MLILFGFGEECLHIINILILAYLIKGCKFHFDYKKLIGASILLLFSLTMYEVYNTTGMTLILNFLVEFLVFIVVVKMDRRNKIVYFLLIIFIESFLTSIVGLLGMWGDVGDKYFNFVDVFKAMMVFCLLSTIACSKFHKSKTEKIEKIDIYVHAYLSLGLLLGTFILLGIEKFGDHISMKLYVSLIVLAILSPIINVLMYVFCIKKYVESSVYKADLKSMEVLLQVQDKYFKEMVDSYEDLKVFRHDVNSYLNTIGKLVNEQMYNELHLLTNDLKQTINADVLICSNVYISASINQFLSSMEKKDIKFTFEYEVFEEVDIKNMHLCSLFYNLLSNAIEAAVQCDGNKAIQLNVSTKNNTLLIIIVNSVNESFNINELEIGKTSKEDKGNHGIGLRSIQDVVNLYNGDIRREVKGNELRTEIILFNALKAS